MAYKTTRDKNTACINTGGGAKNMITNSLTSNTPAYKYNYNSALNSSVSNQTTNTSLRQSQQNNSGQDTVRFSDEAKTLDSSSRTSKNEASKSSEIHAASEKDRIVKIQALNSQVQNGTYSVPSALVANAMMRNLISEIG